MEMHHLKDEVCYECGSRTVVLTQTDQHTNGMWNETRKYACGLHLRFSPNFKRVETLERCPNDQEVQQLKVKRANAMKQIFSLVRNLDVDQAYRQSIIDRLSAL